MAFKHRTIAKTTAYADMPQRVDFDNEEDFLKAVEEYNEAQKGPQFSHDEDAENGPDATGWVDPDIVTGPGVEK